ncbi:hypothetical protein CXB51_021135 [Gossypium anomalum]|uniref:Knl1 C-terminal RWD domain-containing protein n=1 Tax=Gossypium anomalum TaxID=47600 RepID=A0A8J6CZ59_9ROSI|nr:hypothetical protein CXB51_021135 [Gossypium anomalum]
MASKFPDEPPSNTQETDEETIAFRKKLSRRVSFAECEITSVHIFNRDDDYESPQHSTPTPASERGKEVLGLFRDLIDSDDDDNDDDVLSVEKSFLRPMESPSPGGSSTVGSAISNDEDNFFGPVSANFIQPGRLSDSAASDDNHDITMDSITFSMHFRSIAGSESGELNTLTTTGVCLPSEEKTPCQATMPSDPKSFMVLTKAKKVKSPSPVPISKFSGGEESNGMSLVGESMRRYDYGKLSPTLEALLAEGSKEFNAIPTFESTTPRSSSEVALSYGHKNDCTELSNYRNQELCNMNNHDMSGKGISFAQDKMIESTGDSATTLTDQTMCDCSSNTKDGSVAENFVGHQIQTPNQLNQEEMHKSPLAGSIHSLSAKRQQILLDTTNSPRHALFVTPSPKQSGSFLSQGSIKQGGSLPSVLKSNIKLKNLECTPLGSAFNDGILKSKIRLSDSLSSRASACSFSKIMEPSAGFQCQQVTAPTINPEEQLSGVGLKQGEIDGPVTPKNISYLSQDGGTTELLEDKEHYEKYAERMGITTSPSKCTHSGKKMIHHSMTPVDHLDGTRVASAFNSLPMGITREIGKDKRDLDTAYKLVSPLVNRSKEKLCSSTEHHSSLSGNLKPHDQDNSVIIVSREEPNSLETVPSSNYLTATAENRTQSSLSLIKANHLTGTSIVKKLNEGESNGLDMLNASENSRNFPEGFALKLQSRSPEKNIETAIEITQFSGSFIQEQMKVSSSYASPDAPRSKNDQLPLKSGAMIAQSPFRKKQTQSPTSKEPSCSPYRKEMHRGLCGDNMQLPVAKDVLSLSCHSTIQTIDNHLQRSVQDPSPDQDTQNSSKRKRISEVVLADMHPADKNKCIQQSPNFREIGEKNMEHMLEYSNGSNIGNKGIEGGKTLLNMTDISSKLSADTKQLLSPSFDKLNIKMINMLEDILLHQQKVNKLEMLCSEIQSKLGSAYGQSCNIQYKSVAETRLLLYRLVYEKAKLQLMQVKRERLLNQVQLPRTGVRECQMLKLNYVKHPSVLAGRDTQLDNNTCSVKSGENLEGTDDRVTTMKHEADALEKKINNLTKSLCPHFKIKGELSCADTIDLLNDHLKKRTCWGYIRQDMQLWEVDVLQNRNGYHNVILNYHEFLSQSLTLDTSPNSSIFVGNNLNDINISKNFPNMDACSAFAFVFNHEYTKKYVGPKSLAQETQRTSSLLRNLLDVIEEVQIARLEIRGLILTSFHSPSAKQLDLQLAFIDFESGVKLIMSLDMTCLNCGVYPSEILPHHLQTSTTRTDDLHCPLSIEIKAAISNLRAGYSRIIRLCRCVTQVLQSSGR